jgi:hypothetical protein
MKHECKQMKRAKEIQTPLGQAAYSYYSKWMRSYNRRAPTIQVFSTSKYYATFITITKHFQKVQLADVDIFIRLMRTKDIAPNLWTKDAAYSLYLAHLDRTADPMDMAQITIDELWDLSEERGCEITGVFGVMEIHECMELIRKRKLTPWILLRCSTFGNLMRRASQEERKLLEELIRPAYWKYRFDKSPETVTQMTRIVQAMGL